MYDLPKQKPARRWDQRTSQRTNKKGAKVQRVADVSSSVGGEVTEDIEFDANKNVTNDKGCRREKGARAHKLGSDLQSQMSP